eukprot:2185338-Rhodomonas_salina.2
MRTAVAKPVSQYRTSHSTLRGMLPDLFPQTHLLVEAQITWQQHMLRQYSPTPSRSPAPGSSIADVSPGHLGAIA